MARFGEDCYRPQSVYDYSQHGGVKPNRLKNRLMSSCIKEKFSHMVIWEVWTEIPRPTDLKLRLLFLYALVSSFASVWLMLLFNESKKDVLLLRIRISLNVREWLESNSILKRSGYSQKFCQRNITKDFTAIPCVDLLVKFCFVATHVIRTRGKDCSNWRFSNASSSLFRYTINISLTFSLANLKSQLVENIGSRS